MAFNIQDQVKLNTILDSANNTGTVNQVLVSTGSNTLIWSNQGDLSVNGSNTEILFNDSGLLGANNQFIFDKETGRVGIGTNSPTQVLDVNGTINTSANVHIIGSIRDTSGSYGTSGQVLSSTETGLSWIDAGSVSGALTALNGVDNRVAVFTGADEIEGDANFTWDGTSLSVDGGAVFNESGADVDFRVESNNNDHALFVRGSDSAVGINNSNPATGYALDIVSPDTGASTFTYVRLAPPPTATTAQSRLFFAGRSGGTDYESRISGGQVGGLYLTSPREVSLYYNTTTPTERLSADVSGVVINDPGNDVDFRVESNLNDHALFVQGSDGFVGIGNSAPTAELVVQGSRVNVDTILGPTTASSGNAYLRFKGKNNGTVSEATIHADFLSGLTYNAAWKQFFQLNGTEYMRLESQNIIFNDTGGTQNFRVESNNNEHMLFVDGTNDRVGIACSAPTFALDVVGEGRLSDTGVVLRLNDTSGTLGGAITSKVEFEASGTDHGFVGFNTAGGGTMECRNENGSLYLQADADNLHTNSLIGLNVDAISRLELKSSEAVFNEPGNDYDFRVESNTLTHALFVRGSDNNVGIGTSEVGLGALVVRRDDAPSDVIIRTQGSTAGTYYRAKLGLQLGASASGTRDYDILAEDPSNNGGYMNIEYEGSPRITIQASDSVIFNQNGEDIDFRVESDTLTHAFFVQGSDGFIGVNQSAPTFRFDLVDDAAAYVDGEKSVASFSSASDQRSFLKIRNNNGNSTAGAPRAGLDLEVRDHANSPNVMRAWLELNQRTGTGNGGGTSLSVPRDFQIYVDNDGDITSSSGESPSSQVIPGTQILYLSNTEVIFNDPGNDVDFRVESSNKTHALFVQGSDGHVGIGTVPSSSYALHVSDADGILVESTSTVGIHKFVRGTGATTDSRPVIDIDADSQFDAVDGFGPTLRFTISDTGVDDSELGAIGFVRDGSDTLGKFVVGQDSQQLGSVGATQFSVGNAETVVNDQGVDTDFRVESDTNTHALFVQGSDGFVGIGTASPGSPLDISVASGAFGSASALRITSVDGGAWGVYPTSAVANPVWNTNVNSGEQFSWSVGGGEVVRIDTFGKVGIACTAPTVALDVTGDINATGALTATTKSFVIDHPTKPNMKLRYGSLEGPENGVYVRGRLRGNVIELPDYWVGLVDEDTITVNLTPIINKQDLFVKEIKDNKVFVEGSDQINCFFTVYGERKDEPRFEVEY